MSAPTVTIWHHRAGKSHARSLSRALRHLLETPPPIVVDK